MPKYQLFVVYDPDQPEGPPRQVNFIEVAARDDDEAICAADAVAIFAVATVAQAALVRMVNLTTAREVKTVRRPIEISN